MTYREEVLDNLRKKIGVNEEEEFTATFEHAFTFTFKFSHKLLYVKSNDKWEYYPFWSRFISEWESVALSYTPYNPPDGNLYYFITSDKKIGQCIFEKDSVRHQINRYAGNCFRTKEEAEAHIDELCKKLGMEE